MAFSIQAGDTGVAVMSSIGGLSAATCMVIVATIASGIMISNNLVTPVRLTIQWQRLQQHNLKPKVVLFSGCASVVVVMSVAYLYRL